jgi:zinc D-Ala-D-Ala carboxypeptidase
MDISKHISYEEATESPTGTRFGIINDPNNVQLDNMHSVAELVFEPLRVWAAEPIRINSFFRSDALNKKVGGAKNSQHCANAGAAIDLSGTNLKKNSDLFHYIKDHLKFDQLIWEFGNDKQPQWVHVSYNKTGNRNQVLKAVKNAAGKTSYIKF